MKNIQNLFKKSDEEITAMVQQWFDNHITADDYTKFTIMFPDEWSIDYMMEKIEEAYIWGASATFHDYYCMH